MRRYIIAIAIAIPAVLVMLVVGAYAYDEIVKITGWPMGTVKSRISRARIKLREHLLRQPELLPMAFRPSDA